MGFYPYRVMQALRLSRGLDNDDESLDEEFMKMSLEDVIFEYLKREAGGREACDFILESFENLLDMNFNEVQKRLKEYKEMKKEQDERFFELSKANIQDILETRFLDKTSGFSKEQMNQLLNKLVVLLRENFASCDLNGVISDVISNVFDEAVDEIEA